MELKIKKLLLVPNGKLELSRRQYQNSRGIRLRDFSVIPFFERKRLPKEKGVYAMADNDHNILYIGQSDCLHTRILFHEKIKEMKKYPAFIYYFLTEPYYCRWDIEVRLIKEVAPVYNKQWNRKRYTPTSTGYILNS